MKADPLSETLPSSGSYSRISAQPHLTWDPTGSQPNLPTLAGHLAATVGHPQASIRLAVQAGVA